MQTSVNNSLKHSDFAFECYTEIWEDPEYPEKEWHPQRFEWISVSAVNLHPANSQGEGQGEEGSSYRNILAEMTWSHLGSRTSAGSIVNSDDLSLRLAGVKPGFYWTSSLKLLTPTNLSMQHQRHRGRANGSGQSHDLTSVIFCQTEQIRKLLTSSCLCSAFL